MTCGTMIGVMPYVQNVSQPTKRRKLKVEMNKEEVQ